MSEGIRMKLIYAAASLGICLLFSITNAFAFTIDPAECRQPFVFLNQEHPWFKATNLPVVIVPTNPPSGQTFAVCTLAFIYPDHVSVAQTGNHLTLTLFDSGWSFGPNPIIIIGTQVAGLTAGSYLLDVIIDSDTVPLATDFAFDVLPVAVPAFDSLSEALLMILFCIFALQTLRKRPARWKDKGDGSL